jgi:hypothetical protein
VGISSIVGRKRVIRPRLFVGEKVIPPISTMSNFPAESAGTRVCNKERHREKRESGLRPSVWAYSDRIRGSRGRITVNARISIRRAMNIAVKCAMGVVETE